MNRLLNTPNPQHMQQIFVDSPQFSWTRISSSQTVNVIHNVRMRFRVVEYMANLVVNGSSITAETHALIHHRQGFHVLQTISIHQPVAVTSATYIRVIRIYFLNQRQSILHSFFLLPLKLKIIIWESNRTHSHRVIRVKPERHTFSLMRKHIWKLANPNEL